MTWHCERLARFVAAWGNEVAAFRGHQESVTAIAFSPDDALVATASIDHRIRFWPIDTDKVVREAER